MTGGRLLLSEATQVLAGSGVDSAGHDARVLLAHVTGEHPALAGNRSLDDQQTRDFRALVRRRSTREPLQHLLGRAWFRHVEVLVGPGVFVPRPETEVMTGWVVDRLRERPVGSRRVVDLCTGSGVIAKAITDEVPDAQVHAIEVSEQAAEWAARNLAGTGVELQVGDMTSAFPELDGQVDVVVANPPYIPLEAYASVAPEARDHDPTEALFSGLDGLDAIRSLVVVAARLLRRGGLLAYEHAEVQADAAPAVAVHHGGFAQVRDHLDLTGRPRFVTAVRHSGSTSTGGSGAPDLAGWAR